MSEQNVMQNLAEQISRLSSDQMEAMADYLRELSETENEPSEIENQYFTFWCDGQLFGIGVKQVIQIVQMENNITPLPDFPPYIKGVLSIRGEMAPVMDLRLRLKKESIDYSSRTCIILIHVQGHSFGLVVDSVNDVETIPAEDICPPPRQSGHNVNYLTGIAKRKDAILILDVDYLLSDKEIGTILELSEVIDQANGSEDHQ